MTSLPLAAGPQGLARAVRGALRALFARSAVPLLDGQNRVWLLNGILGLSAVALYIMAIYPLHSIAAPYHLELLLLIVMFAAVEVFFIQLQFRRESLSFSLSEMPLVFGLFFAAPHELLIAQAIGSAAALWLHRKQSPVKIAFNVANLTFSGALALIVFHAIVSTGELLGPAGWAATFAAAIVTNVVAVTGITCAMWLSGGRPLKLSQMFGSGSVATFFNTTLALVGVTLVWNQPASVWLLAVLAGMLFLAYRSYGSMLRKHDALELLYESTRDVGESLQVELVVRQLLDSMREMFRAEHAQVTLFATEEGPATTSTQGVDGAESLLQEVTLDPTEGIWARLVAEQRGIVLSRPIENVILRGYFAAQGIRDVVVTPLRSGEAIVGMLQIGNRIGDVNTFGDEDLRLFETLANHASVSLQNSTLVDRLRKQADDNEYQALHDALTGLPNRTLFRRRLQAALLNDSTTAALIMDLDRFKEVNDTLGHHNGDLLLAEIGRRLSGLVHPNVTVARLSGDEFAILLEETSIEQAAATAQSIRTALHEPFILQDLTLETEASIGIALAPLHATDADTLVQRADVAMYLAKAGDEGFEVYDPQRDEYSPGRLALMSELRTAIEDNQLMLAYQPKLDLRSGKAAGVEALVRWIHPSRGLMTPDRFIPMAEHTGLIRPLTRRLLELAISQNAAWARDGEEVIVSVNVSVRDLTDLRLADYIGELLERYAVPASRLQLEITESGIMADPARVIGILSSLHEMGVELAIDDFGTGYSSLSYLKRLPVNELKIDKSFVMSMLDDENDLAIVRSTIELGRGLGLRTVAEGVESAEMLAKLRELGCDVAQGYHISRGISAQEISIWLAGLHKNGFVPQAEQRKATSLGGNLPDNTPQRRSTLEPMMPPAVTGSPHDVVGRSRTSQVVIPVRRAVGRPDRRDAVRA